jgi:hypothetical protein
MITAQLTVLENDFLLAFNRLKAAEAALDVAHKELLASAILFQEVSGNMNLPHPDRLRALMEMAKK